MSRVAVTGAAGPVGRRLCALLATDTGVEVVRAVDRDAVPDLGDKVERVRVRLRDGDLRAAFTDVDVVCHLAGSDPLEGTPVDHDLHTTRRVLEAAAACGVTQIIARTSATVYGAWPDNPIPLTEADRPRPNAEAAWVQIRVRLEELLDTFAAEHPDVAVAVLRPAVTVCERGPDELGRVLATGRLVSSAEDEPPLQFVHADDVAAAVDAVRRASASGAFNVAPDGWMDGDRVRALVGGSPRLPLPRVVSRRLGDFGWRHRLAPTPPGFEDFVDHAWVVANDRLRALGWEPTHDNDEAFVAGHGAAPWALITPQRRQELALGITGVAIISVLGAGAVAVRRRLGRAG